MNDENNKLKPSETTSEMIDISETDQNESIRLSDDEGSFDEAPTEISASATHTSSDDSESEDIESLEIAAQEWRKDPVSEANSEEPVTLVADPYGFSALDVQAEQSSDEPIDEAVDLVEDEEIDIDLDEETTDGLLLEESESSSEPELNLDEVEESFLSPSESDPLLESLSATIQAQDEQAAAESLAQIAEVLVDAQAENDAQIAEDRALEAQALADSEAQTVAPMDPELAAALPKTPVADENGQYDLQDLESAIEAILFMVEKPMSSQKLQEWLGPDFSFHFFQEALTNLKSRYAEPHHGFELVEVAGGYQFRTKPTRAALAKKLARIQFQRLSSGAMETLAIVAYRQPVMKEDIDEVRGVDSSHFVRTLMDRKLIHITGRSELPGRPMLYETTEEFLQVFGIKEIRDLPSLRELEQMVPESSAGETEDPRVKQMRKLVSEMKADSSVNLIYDPSEDEKFLKDIRERVKSIEISTPSLEAEKEAAKQAAALAALGTEADSRTEPAKDLFEAVPPILPPSQEAILAASESELV